MKNFLRDVGLDSEAGLIPAGIYREAGLQPLGGFNPTHLNPYLLFDTRTSMLAEAETTADFLDSVPLLKNLADPSGATDAKQFTATKQPTALPLAANGKGYCYVPNVLGNAPAVEFPRIESNDDFAIEMDVYLLYTNGCYLVTGINSAHRFYITSTLFLFSGGLTAALNSALSTGFSTIKIERISGNISLYQDGVLKSTPTACPDYYVLTHLSFNGQFSSGIPPLHGYIQKTTLSINGTEVLNIDFTSPRIPHGASKFTCETGQVVTVNTSGNNPATIIKKPVLRFDGVDDFMDGVLGQTLSSGYLFAAFSVLGNGGDTWVRLFSTNPTGGTDASGSMMIRRYSGEDAFRVRYDAAGSVIHDGMYDSARGDILLDVNITNGAQTSFINNADEENKTLSGTVTVDDFVLAARKEGDFNMPIDLEYLAFFPASLTDKQADQVRNYINNRNKVFDRWDTDGYYFFDPQKATFVGDFSASNTLDGYITGSDKGDTDVRSDLTLEQAVIGNAQPSTDGYTITFSDNAEFLNFTNGASQSLAGWQIVGTSLGTFAYKVDSDAITELNLLGNLGNAAYRQAGDLYGIILLPDTATNRDIEAARQLLISRGAADEVTVTSLVSFWRERADIVEFRGVNTSTVTDFFTSWFNCSSLTSFPLIDTSSASRLSYTWYQCYSLESFPLIVVKNAVAFNYTWYNCTSLESFPAGMFDTWNPSSIFNNVFERTWDGCTSLTPQSVENILVSIAASGKYATTSGASGGTALTDPEIDIDYDGSGLTAATTTAIATLKSRGWGIRINGNPQ